MAKDFKKVISSKYPAKEVKLVEINANEDVVKVRFSIGKGESIAIDMAAA